VEQKTRTTHSPRLLSAIASYRAARVELAAAIQAEAPGRIVVHRRGAYYVDRGRLVAGSAVRVVKPREAQP
jgi:hypothetical protein